MALQNLYVDGQFLGSREVPNFKRSMGEMRPAVSLALFCNQCGEIWGRFATVGARYTQVWQLACAAHGDGRLWRSDLDEAPEFDLAGFPPEALRYQLEREIELAERHGV